MITYELTKQLKEAGFEEIIGKPMFIEDDFFPPSISELIESCGDNFLSLDSPFIETNSGWCAVGMSNGDRLYIKQEGLTPEEAVAKLWLKLNKK